MYLAVLFTAGMAISQGLDQSSSIQRRLLRPFFIDHSGKTRCHLFQSQKVGWACRELSFRERFRAVCFIGFRLWMVEKTLMCHGYDLVTCPSSIQSKNGTA